MNKSEMSNDFHHHSAMQRHYRNTNNMSHNSSDFDSSQLGGVTIPRESLNLNSFHGQTGNLPTISYSFV
jgi:hypothetical protein